MDDCIEMLDEMIDDLTEVQLSQIKHQMETESSPAKFVKWLIRKLKEWLEQQ